MSALLLIEWSRGRAMLRAIQVSSAWAGGHCPAARLAVEMNKGRDEENLKCVFILEDPVVKLKVPSYGDLGGCFFITIISSMFSLVIFDKTPGCWVSFSFW